MLIPRPRVNLILYHGVLAPRAGWRTHVVICDAWLDCAPAQATEIAAAPAPPADASPVPPWEFRRRQRGW